jgi:serine O-acetyltransferase
MPDRSPLRQQVTYLREDWKRNRSFAVRTALATYRLGRGVQLSSLPSLLKKAVRGLSTIVNAIIVTPTGTGKLYPTADIGPGIVMAHRMTGSVIHPHTRIGKAAKIFHHVTIGNAGTRNGVPRVPVIGDNVTIFPGAILVGDITIGNDVVIGPNSLVNQDVPSGSKVVAPRATILEPATIGAANGSRPESHRSGEATPPEQTKPAHNGRERREGHFDSMRKA